MHCVLEDSRGYLWLGTDNGAARFDGYTFRTYDAKDGLQSNFIHNIHEDHEGRIWLNAHSGENYIWNNDTIIPYEYNDIILGYKKRYAGVGLAHISDDQTAYFELRNLGILKIDKQGKDTLITSKSPLGYLIYHEEGLPRSLHTEISRTYEADWVAWSNYILDNQIVHFEFISDAGHFEKELSYYKPGERYNFNAEVLSGEELLFFHQGELYCFENEKLIWESLFDFNSGEIREDASGAIWFCGIGRSTGLRRFENLEALKNGEYNEFLGGISISDVYHDTQGGLWVSTLEQGIFYAANPEIVTFDQSFGLSENFVNAVAFKNEQEVYMGCKNGMISLVDIAENKILNRLENPDGTDTWDLLYDRVKQALWSSAKYWKEGQWNFLSLRNSQTHRIENFVMEVFRNQHFNAQRELLGCNHSGFYIIDTQNDTVKFDPFPHGLRERTYAIHTGLDGSVWVGNNRGLFLFENNGLTTPEVDHPAFKNRVEDIDEMPDSSLVFATKGFGIIHWKGDRITQLSTEDGLTSNMIEDVHVDEAGVLWVGTLNGLNKISFDENKNASTRSFTVANGLSSNEIYQVKSNAGQLWLCTSEGLIKFVEPQLDTSSRAPIIQGLNINNEAGALTQNQVYAYDQNNLEIDFLTINFKQNGRIPYRYRINDNADWQYTENRSVNYAQLAPGSYQFEVQSQNESGYWSASTTYRFSILPPWWKTWWAISLGLSLVLAGFVYFFRQRTAALKREAAVQQQITNLERSALQAQMNPHFIFNCLNSIQNFILKNDKKKAVEYLARFAKLVRYNLDIAMKGNVTLEEEIQLLDHYLALEQQRFNQQFDYSINREERINVEAIKFPPLLIQPYVENAIIHGLAQKSGKGDIQIDFTVYDGQLVVKVRDNGIGYHENNGTKKHNFKSVGMTITRKRLALLGTQAEKAVQINTLYDAEGETIGTEVDIIINTKEQSNGKD